MVTAIISAAGKNRRMQEDLKARGMELKHKLLLEIDNMPLIVRTTENILSTGVDKCIIVIGHFSNKISPVLENINDKRIKIVKNPEINVELSQSLLNGVNHVKNDFCLCVAADQPTISTKTLKKLIKGTIENPNSHNIVSILARGKTGYLNSAKGLGMPFVCHSHLLKKYLAGKKDNLNPILREMVKDGIIFYGIPPYEDLELVNINRYDDYLLVKNYLS